MKVESLINMKKGWLVGNFNPSILRSEYVEVGLKRYRKGQKEKWHYHKISTEITVVIEGKVKMCEQVFTKDSIITLSPGEGTAFEALEDSITLVIKSPSSIDDKYFNKDA